MLWPIMRNPSCLRSRMFGGLTPLAIPALGSVVGVVA